MDVYDRNQRKAWDVALGIRSDPFEYDEAAEDRARHDEIVRQWEAAAKGIEIVPRQGPLVRLA